MHGRGSKVRQILGKTGSAEGAVARPRAPAPREVIFAHPVQAPLPIPQIVRSSRPSGAKDSLVILTDPADLRNLDLDRNDRQYLLEQLKGEGPALCDISGRLVMVHQVRKQVRAAQLEAARRAGNAMALKLAAAKRDQVQVVGHVQDPEAVLALLEGLVLGSYQFTAHKTKDLPKALSKITVAATAVSAADLEELVAVCHATCTARDLVNQPYSSLTSMQLGKEAQRLGKEAGVEVKVLVKKQIEAEGMGGLLAVNQGSIDPPVFIIMEWKPKNAVNKDPVVLVGKGVTYDTGGLSLKPTPNSMDSMKCDMAGAAAVLGAISAVARCKLPVHVVALAPSTDNRPGGNAFAPGDVLRMHNGLTVENLNSDAEGRLILADALSYGERHRAETIITVATLTGAAVRAIGTGATVTMGNAPEAVFGELEAAAGQVHERVARMPFWEEYAEELKSDVADMKNIGGALAGQITAGKFLERFTTRPYIHLDIAGPAFLDKRDHYRVKGGTGVGVRLLHQFIKRRAQAGSKERK